MRRWNFWRPWNPTHGLSGDWAEFLGTAQFNENPPKLQEAENKSRATPRVKETTDKVKNGNNYGCAFPRSLRFAEEKRDYVIGK